MDLLFCNFFRQTFTRNNYIPTEFIVTYQITDSFNSILKTILSIFIRIQSLFDGLLRGQHTYLIQSTRESRSQVMRPGRLGRAMEWIGYLGPAGTCAPLWVVLGVATDVCGDPALCPSRYPGLPPPLLLPSSSWSSSGSFYRRERGQSDRRRCKSARCCTPPALCSFLIHPRPARPLFAIARSTNHQRQCLDDNISSVRCAM